MTSAIEICNLALTHLGCENILSFTQNNTIARKCALVYPQARDVALSGNSWGFAKKNETLALITTVTIPGYSYIVGSNNSFTPSGNIITILKEVLSDNITVIFPTGNTLFNISYVLEM